MKSSMFIENIIYFNQFTRNAQTKKYEIFSLFFYVKLSNFFFRFLFYFNNKTTILIHKVFLT